MPKLCLTGGIACGKSLLSRYLRERGIETLDADDIVHELIPAEERRRLAPLVFNNPSARKELESRIHPLVKARLEAFTSAAKPGVPRLAIIPLLFECKWDAEYDIICCVISDRAKQIARMMQTRGYTRDEAEARLSAQMDVAEKARKSHYVIPNNGTAQELEQEAARFAAWLKERIK